MVPSGNPISGYLTRPLRSLRQTCLDTAHRRGLTVPDCDDCNLGSVCEGQARRARQAEATHRRRDSPVKRT